MVSMDITTCNGVGCPIADKCLRNYVYCLSKLENHVISVFQIAPYDEEKGSCDFFIERK